MQIFIYKYIYRFICEYKYEDIYVHVYAYLLIHQKYVSIPDYEYPIPPRRFPHHIYKFIYSYRTYLIMSTLSHLGNFLILLASNPIATNNVIASCFVNFLHVHIYMHIHIYINIYTDKLCHRCICLYVYHCNHRSNTIHE